jgi:putative heme-binding domain-containing protein
MHLSLQNERVANKNYDISSILKSKADINKGEKLFVSSCRTCHKAGKEGSTVAPNLTFISKKFGDRDLLNAIINPSAAVAFGYETWMITTKDNETYYGFLISDNEQSMTLRDVGGNNHLLEKSVIKTAKKQDKSLMPEAAQIRLSDQDLADIVGYLKQVK